MLALQASVRLAGGLVNTGAFESSTVMVCVAVRVLPHSSVAVHLRVTTYSCGQLPAALDWPLNVTWTYPEHPSVAVGLPGVGGNRSLHSIVTDAGTEVKFGAWVSCIVINCTAVVELPQLSVASQVRINCRFAGQLK